MDIIMVLLVIFGSAVIGIIAYYTLSDVNTDIQADPDLNADTKAVSSNLTTSFPDFMDSAFLLMTILLWVFIIVSSFMIDSHPIFMILTLLLLIFAFGVVMVLGNTFEEFALEPEFSTYDDKFPITYYILDNILIIMIIMGGSALITMYGKNKFVGG